MVQANTNVITQEQVAQTLNSVTISNLAQCNSDAVGSQKIAISASGTSSVSDIVASQSFSQSLSCFSSQTNQTQLLADISAQLAATATAQSSWLGGVGVNKSVISETSVNDIVNKYSVSNAQKCLTSLNVPQSITITASDAAKIYNVQTTQNASSLAKCMFTTANITDLSTQIAADMNASADSGAVSFNKIAGYLAIAAIAVAVAGLLGVAVKVLAKKHPASNMDGTGVGLSSTSATSALPTASALAGHLANTILGGIRPSNPYSHST